MNLFILNSRKIKVRNLVWIKVSIDSWPMKKGLKYYSTSDKNLVDLLVIPVMKVPLEIDGDSNEKYLKSSLNYEWSNFRSHEQIFSCSGILIFCGLKTENSDRNLESPITNLSWFCLTIHKRDRIYETESHHKFYPDHIFSSKYNSN